MQERKDVKLFGFQSPICKENFCWQKVEVDSELEVSAQ